MSGNKIQGQYISFTSSSVVAGDDLISIAESRSGVSGIVAKKLIVSTSGSLSFSINGGTSSVLFRDVDNVYRLSLNPFEVMVSSFTINQTSACPVNVSLVY